MRSVHILLYSERNSASGVDPVVVRHFDDIDDLVAHLKHLLDFAPIAYFRVESVGYFND